MALAPATLCALAQEEALSRNLPLFDHVLAELSAGMEIRPNGDSSYELFEDGVCAGRLEIFEAPILPAMEMPGPLKGRLAPEVP
jgi:hypothetical protein